MKNKHDTIKIVLKTYATPSTEEWGQGVNLSNM